MKEFRIKHVKISENVYNTDIVAFASQTFMRVVKRTHNFSYLNMLYFLICFSVGNIQLPI